jgi:hypothetical protein
MMKKLLVLVLVLSMATLANAALVLTIDGPATLLTGETGTYTIGYSGADLGLVSSDVDVIATLGSIGGGAGITTNRDVALDVFGINGATGNYECAIINDVLATDLGSPLMSFQFTAGMVTGPAVIQLLDNGQMDTTWTIIEGAVLPTMNVMITPEPMTLGLLALGGLFIRRK